MGNKTGKDKTDQGDQKSQIKTTPDNTTTTIGIKETNTAGMGSSRINYAEPIVREPRMREENMSVEQISQFCFSSTAILPSHHNNAVDSSRITTDDGTTNDEDQQNRHSSLDNTSLLETATSRTGRQNQRYATSSTTNLPTIRLTVGSVPILRDGKILLVSSTNKKGWILPKGGWELDERCEDGALRETYEEGGILGTLGVRLGDVEYDRLSKGTKSTRIRMHMYLLYVMEVREEWPESWRARKAVDIETAIEMVTGRPEFQTVLREVKEKGYHLIPSLADGKCGKDGDGGMR